MAHRYPAVGDPENWRYSPVRCRFHRRGRSSPKGEAIGGDAVLIYSNAGQDWRRIFFRLRHFAACSTTSLPGPAVYFATRSQAWRVVWPGKPTMEDPGDRAARRGTSHIPIPLVDGRFHGSVRGNTWSL